MRQTPSPSLKSQVLEDRVGGSKRLFAALAACNVAMAPLIFLVAKGEAVIVLIAMQLSQQEAAAFWISWAVAAVAIVATSALLIVPLIALILRPSKLDGAIRGACVFIVGAGVACWIALVMIGAFSAMPWPPVIVYLSVSAMVASMLATLSIPLLMAHHQGFRLRIGRGSSSHPPPLSPSS